MSLVNIKKISPLQVSSLHVLFLQAIDNDFAYFSSEYRDSVIEQNNKYRLLLGSVHPSRLFLGVFNDKEIVGYSISGIEKKQAFLYWLFIQPQMRKQKLGKRLLMATEDKLKARKVDAISLVTHNQKDFYNHHGYIVKDVMSHKTTGVKMQKMQKVLA